jgi:hypothetical protein
MECYYSRHNLRKLGLLVDFAASQIHFASRSLTAAVVIVAHNYAVEIAAGDSQYSVPGSH